MNPLLREPLSPLRDASSNELGAKTATPQSKSKLNFRFTRAAAPAEVTEPPPAMMALEEAVETAPEKDEPGLDKKRASATAASSGYGKVTVITTKVVQRACQPAAKMSDGPSPKRGRTELRSDVAAESASSKSRTPPRTSARSTSRPPKAAIGGTGAAYGVCARVADRAKALLPSDEGLDALLEKKVKAPKFDYKQRSEQAVLISTELRVALKAAKEGQRSFVNDVVGIEDSLLSLYGVARGELEAIGAECHDLRLRTALAEQTQAQTQIKATDFERAASVAEAKLVVVEKELSRANALAVERLKDLGDAVALAESLQKDQKVSTEKLARNAEHHEAELARVTTAFKMDFEAKIRALETSVVDWTSKANRSAQELKSVAVAHESAVKELQATKEAVAEKASAVDSLTHQTAMLKKDCEIFTVKLDSVTAQLDQKSGELKLALSSLGDIQKAHCEREAQAREAAAVADHKLHSFQSEVSSLREEASTLRNQAVLMGSDLAGTKEALFKAKADLEARTKASDAAASEAREAISALAIEKQLRARAESREEDERRERTAACAQLLAQTKAQESQVEHMRESLANELKKADERTAAVERDLHAARETIDGVNERVVAADGETRQLRSLLEHERSNVEELVAMARQNGEMDGLKHRLAHQASDHERALAEAQAKIAALEEEVRDGESARRKMHNIIQELRGNVRVFARVRPFLPADHADDAAVPVIQVRPDGASLRVEGSGDRGEAHSFTFDKSFPPSTGQEAVFTEVSEFVQSALDGYQVCLFSYGQTGSGKTHTMQGGRDGHMRGIIPRSIEKVGQYKVSQEAQGWIYTMHVTFVEIYNEIIRDLLRGTAKQEGVLEIRTTKEGQMSILGVTRLEVDPSDAAAIESIMEMAARHRAVSSTDMNAESSRSHSIFTLHLEGVNSNLKSSLSGALNLVDLAGSERLSRSGATGDRMKETQAINKSLSCLTDVFMAISNKNSHVPFRNSKLTHLLSPCLSGDGKTLMMVNLSPTEASAFESVCSLRFAATVNKCELGRPKKQYRELSAAATPATAPAKSKAAK